MHSSPVWMAVRRGLRLRCPCCGTGKLFRRYIKVEPHCLTCGEDNGRHRVDDAASYLTILLIGHVIVAPALALQYWLDVSVAVALGVALPAVSLMTLASLPFIKGGVLGILSATDRRAIAEGVRPAPPPR